MDIESQHKIRRVPGSYHTAACCSTCVYAQLVQKYMEPIEYYCNFSGSAPEIPKYDVKYPHPSKIARDEWESYNFVSPDGTCDNYIKADPIIIQLFD